MNRTEARRAFRELVRSGELRRYVFELSGPDDGTKFVAKHVVETRRLPDGTLFDVVIPWMPGMEGDR